MSRRKVHRSRVWTASLSDPATTSPALLRVTAAMSASNRTVTTATLVLERGFGDHRLLDRDQPVVERQAVLCRAAATASAKVSSTWPSTCDLTAVELALPIGFEDHPVGGLGAFEEMGDVEAGVGGQQRADGRARRSADKPCRRRRRRSAGPSTAG